MIFSILCGLENRAERFEQVTRGLMFHDVILHLIPSRVAGQCRHNGPRRAGAGHPIRGFPPAVREPSDAWRR